MKKLTLFFLSAVFLRLMLFRTECETLGLLGMRVMQTMLKLLITRSGMQFYKNTLYKMMQRSTGVNYAQLKQDREELDNYIKSLTTITIRDYSKKEQKAYWINLI